MKPRLFPVVVLMVVLSLFLSACGAATSLNAPILRELKSAVDQTEFMPLKAESDAAGVTNETVPPAPSGPTSEGAAALAAYQGALTSIYEKVNPSVVNINVLVKADQTSLEGLPFNLPGEDPSTPESPFAAGLGSGFVWDTEGHIITNNHVVENAEKIQVTFADGTTVDATLVGADPNSDLAVIKVDSSAVELQPISVGDSNAVKVGQLAVAIGNPFGLDGTMTVGIVSALNRSLPTGDGTGPSFSLPNLIQTDAPINPGNSGGVLVNSEGELIGVTTAIESPVRANAGIGFVVPSAAVKKVVPILIEKGAYEYPYLGISGGTLTPEFAKAMDLDENTRGVLVSEVVDNGPAAQAGLRGSSTDATINGMPVKVGGDVITAIDGQPIKEMDDLIGHLSANTSVGQKVTLTILRDGAEMNVEAILAARPAQTYAVAPEAQTEPPAMQQPEGHPETDQDCATCHSNNGDNQGSPNSQPAQNRARLGIMGMDLTADLAKSLGLTVDNGVLVIQVTPNTPASEAGLLGGTEPVTIDGQEFMSGGDVILALDGQAVSSVAQLREYLGKAAANAAVTLTVLRDGAQIEVPVTLGE